MAHRPLPSRTWRRRRSSDRPDIMSTVYRSRREGLKAISRVRQIQDEIGRGLSLLLVGGAQYVKDVAGRLASFTLIDSQPFKKSLYRKQLRPVGNRRRWEDTWTAQGQKPHHDEIIM